ncbi:MAG: sulfite exporter TauE/SafE family protein [Bacteroidetes bacterium]|nr:MAG: sulfite exporter TauE/SafE family protein [Bacteroidota bacterium]
MMIFWTSFILGIGSSFHCLGMCGPLALAIPVNRSSTTSTLLGILQYNLGRISAYALLGVLIGFIGISIELLGVLQILSILAGILLILFAWSRKFSNMSAFQPISDFLRKFSSKYMGKLLASESRLKLFGLGALNGILPCGMVYLALMNALLSGDPFGGAMAMGFFGLGTLPAMMAVGFAAKRFSGGIRTKISKWSPYLITLVGVLVILRGANLDIPYLSPKISLKKHQEMAIENKKAAPEVEMSCCHSKESCED